MEGETSIREHTVTSLLNHNVAQLIKSIFDLTYSTLPNKSTYPNKRTFLEVFRYFHYSTSLTLVYINGEKVHTQTNNFDQKKVIPVNLLESVTQIIAN